MGERSLNTVGQDSHPHTHVYTTPPTELAIPHRRRRDGTCEKPLPTHLERELLPSSLPTGDPGKTITVSSSSKMKG